jgi:hypothetical protein
MTTRICDPSRETTQVLPVFRTSDQYPLEPATFVTAIFDTHWQKPDNCGFRKITLRNKEGYDRNITELIFFAKPNGYVDLTVVYKYHGYGQLLHRYLQSQGLFCDENPFGRYGKESGDYTRECTCESRNLDELKTLYGIIQQNNTIECEPEVHRFIQQILENKVPRVPEPEQKPFLHDFPKHYRRPPEWYY